jgi:curved DNA-binding protein CbpA
MNLQLAYFIFGVSPNTTLGELKKRYWRLAKIHHPDSGGKVDKMQEINDAYKVLKEHIRGLHDRKLYSRRISSYGKEAFFVASTTEDFEV